MTGPEQRSVHRDPALVGLVALGGGIGTALRAWLEDVVPRLTWSGAELPLTTFGINVVGAFALGVLLETLALRGADTGRRRRLRVFAGSGVLGGFTTYSAFMLEADTLVRGGHTWLGVAYVAASLVLGLLAAWGGIAAAGRGRS
ncbi:Camphor resistance CrcB protein [Beutenbergia cavernae DSM 12333]|uniref:Fluoride-specific ion channel FluC n=1 Tax=Beutenbergia cavernae (strain ATCC BAA-8 / DSM 12333 / CCUG 43141 / JCM 11478 / NBRC 16432 / NCIMB 13614 / HKI 0122) TaxID=471853 RepID=C5BXB4_BEUC1|nr:CrcB family protein [Beutenbergia cavernae]ACQ78789.1 Camphor resistance CrcB protein [Beutenbergia cavernae DSM 12333]